MRAAFAILAVCLAPGCMSVKTFADATQDVNEDFALGAQLRDRCEATGDVDPCLAWQDYKRREEAEIAGMDYDKALARWERNGPY